MGILLTSVLLAHVLGEFVLRPASWTRNKERLGFRSPSLYLHLAVHAVLLAIAFRFDVAFVLPAGLILIAHGLIDTGRIRLEGRISPILLLLIDQLAHLMSIVLVLGLHFPLSEWPRFEMEPQRVVLFLLTLLGATQVSAVLIAKAMGSWELPEDDKQDSLAEAGRYIGILERAFVFGFILLDEWSAIGLLIAAKSVFRFGDLTKAKDRKLTEYMLIGTLLSFGLAMLCGLSYRFFSAIL